MWLSIFVCEGSRSFYVPGMQHSFRAPFFILPITHFASPCCNTVKGFVLSLFTPAVATFPYHFLTIPSLPSSLPRLMTDPLTPMQVLQDLTNQEIQADEEQKEAAAADAAGRGY